MATPRDSVRRVANQPKTPKHGVRVPDEVWEAAKRRAHGDGKGLGVS